MAIFNPGPLVGQVSGRVGGTVFSHNRGGAYIRNGSIPYAVYSQKALQAKSALSESVRASESAHAARTSFLAGIRKDRYRHKWPWEADFLNGSKLLCALECPFDSSSRFSH